MPTHHRIFLQFFLFFLLILFWGPLVYEILSQEFGAAHFLVIGMAGMAPFMFYAGWKATAP